MKGGKPVVTGMTHLPGYDVCKFNLIAIALLGVGTVGV